jgi:hypothetical protein
MKVRAQKRVYLKNNGEVISLGIKKEAEASFLISVNAF